MNTRPSESFIALLQKVEQPYLTLLHMRYVRCMSLTRITAYFILDEEHVRADLDRAHEAWVKHASTPALMPERLHSRDLDQYLPAIALVLDSGVASVAHIQRKLKLGFNHTNRLMDQMELDGFVGPHNGSKPRQILLNEQHV